MANKRITELTLRTDVDATVNFAGDDAAQTWRVTAAQILAYIRSEMVGAGELKATGDIFMCGAAAPTGSLLCDGTAVSRTTYAALFTKIGTTFGVGDGSTTFNVPDFRNVAPFGANASTRSINDGSTTVTQPAIALGATANDRMQGHFHTNTHTHSLTDPGHAHNVTGGGFPQYVFNNAASGATGGTIGNSGTPQLFAASTTTGISLGSYTGNTGAPTTDGTNGSPRTGTTTAPARIGINFAIKT